MSTYERLILRLLIALLEGRFRDRYESHRKLCAEAEEYLNQK